MKHKFSSMGRVAIALVLALSLSLVMAVPVSAAGLLTDVTAVPTDDMEEATTDYAIGFTTATTDTVKTVVIAFEAGFTGVAENVEVTGIGPGVLTGTPVGDITYTVTAPVEIPALTPITISFSGVTNPAAGTYDVTVTTKDTGATTIDTKTETDAVTITPKPLSFAVVAGTDDIVTAGVAFSVTVTAMSEGSGGGTAVEGYTGDHLITFTPPGTAGETIPGFELINFVAGEGTSTPSFILTDTSVTPTIDAEDLDLVVSGTSAAITINPTAFAAFIITGAPSSPVTAGVPFTDPIIVTAVDADDNTVEDYIGTVSWTSSDPTATAGAGLPASEALVLGTCTFDAADFVLKTVNEEDPFTQTITVTGDGVSEDASITVDPAGASQWTVVAAPTSIRADDANASTITATVYDEFDNIDTNWSTNAIFATSLGAITGTGGGKAFADGVATATLTSDGVVGTATILVTSTTLPDKTVTVTLVAPDLLAEVWVDATDGAAGNAGTEAEPFATITAAIAAAAEGGTVNVAAGTYSESVIIAKQLTLKGANYGVSAVTGDRGLESIIDVGASDLVSISASDVILDGFMITGDNGNRYRVEALSNSTTDGVQIRNNVIPFFTYASGNGQGIFIWPDSTVSNWVISNNTVAADGTAVWFGGAGTNNTISGNLIGDGGICVEGTMENTTIENNTISNTKTEGSGVSLDSAADGVTITGNTFSGTLDNGNGVRLWSPTKVSTFAIHQNNFTSDFGTGSAVNNETVDQVDATNNWWGNDSGPEHILNPDGTGEKATGYVDYYPWLPAAYTEPVDPVEPVTTATIDLVAGYNLVSLSLIPDAPDIDTMTADLEPNLVKIYRYDALAETPDWLVYNPALPLEGSDLLILEDDWGYWVKMDAVGSFTFTGSELVEDPEELPPSYDVVEGWNLIGFKSTTSSGIAAYLGGVSETLDAIYGYQDGAFFIPTELEPGLGYWIAVTGPGTIYP